MEPRMAPITETPTVKPSFAKVAAKAYVPQKPKEIASNTKAPPAIPQTPVLLQNNSPSPDRGIKYTELAIVGKRDMREQPRAVEIRLNRLVAQNSVQANAQDPAQRDENSVESQPIDGPCPIAVSNPEDSATQLSSSDSSGKPPSHDGKSVASGATFALDEKESIRPDESASIRAIEEEDVLSVQGSVAADPAGSRGGSENGAARAFRDQLHEIAIMGPRGGPPGRFQTGAISPDARAFETTPRVLPQQLQNGTMPSGSPSVLSAPDEKLLQALESPKDRLFVLKLEQDLTDFVNNPKEQEFVMPNCNSFYRLLAHRLADYYLLDHMLDESVKSLKITKTPYCRIPPPLAKQSSPSSVANTPGPNIPARKIMRRGDGSMNASGTNTTANSAGASKATSDAEGDSGSDSAPRVKDRSAMTREEREAEYQKVRQRIFGDEKAAEANEESKQVEEKDPSRSSSASGKKGKKKQRNYSDDGFEARSQFMAHPMYGQNYSAPTYPAEGGTMYYGNYTTIMPNQYGMVSPPIPYANGFSPMQQMDGQSQYPWGYQANGMPNGMVAGQQNGTVSGSYDFTADFQRMSFNPQSMPGQVPPNMPTQSYNGYQNNYQTQAQPMNQPWSQPAYPMFQGPTGQYGPMNYGSRPMSSSSVGPNAIPYGYGQFPGQAYANGNQGSNGMPMPMPGNYNAQRFNPQSQTFVPSLRGGQQQLPARPPMPQMHSPNPGYANLNVPMQNQSQRPSPANIPAQPYNSGNRIPSNGSGNNNISVSQPPTHPLPQPVVAQPPTSTQPPTTRVAATSALTLSTIAKWGSPSSLPPKPPPPAVLEPTNYHSNIRAVPFTSPARVQLSTFAPPPPITAGSSGPNGSGVPRANGRM